MTPPTRLLLGSALVWNLMSCNPPMARPAAVPVDVDDDDEMETWWDLTPPEQKHESELLARRRRPTPAVKATRTPRRETVDPGESAPSDTSR